MIFRSRDEQTPNYATGQLDYLRVYSEVAEDFAALPAPPTVSPNKAMPEVFEKLDKQFGDRPGRKQMLEELYRESTPLADDAKAQDEALMQIYTYELGETPEAIPKTLALRDAYYKLQAQREIKQHELKKNYVVTDAVVKKQQEIKLLMEQMGAINKEYSKRRSAVEKEYREAPKDSPKGLAYKAWQEDQNNPADQELAKKRDANNKESAEIQTRIKTIREEIAASLKPQLDVLSTQIDKITTQLAARSKELTENSGPVAEVFAAALKEADDESKRDLQNRRDAMLHQRGEHGGPPTGFLHEDMQYMKLWGQLQDAQRLEKALLNDALLQNKSYIDANAQQFALQERQQAMRVKQNEHALTNQNERVQRWMKRVKPYRY